MVSRNSWTKIISAGRGSIAADTINGSVVITGDSNQVAGAGSSGNVFSNSRNVVHANLGNIELISDGSITEQVDIRIEGGRLFINGRVIDL